MKNAIRITALLLLVTVLLSSCKQKVYEESGVKPTMPPVPVTESTTRPPATEPHQTGKKFNFSGIEMGMNNVEVQNMLGQERPVAARNNKYYFTNTFKGIAGIDPEVEKDVFFIFNPDDMLEEIQYIVTNKDGITYDESVEMFEKTFGESVPYTSVQGRQEAIWLFKDVYVVVTKEDDVTTVVSYFEKTLFETDYKKEVAAYRKGGEES